MCLRRVVRKRRDVRLALHQVVARKDCGKVHRLWEVLELRGFPVEIGSEMLSTVACFPHWLDGTHNKRCFKNLQRLR